MKSIILAVLILLVSFQPSYAKITTPSPFPVTTSINSLEYFWPLAPGKTLEDHIYILKTLTEKVRGLLIFGKPEKVDYLLFLTTKRVLEAEKLINERKSSLADQTFDMGLNNLEEVRKIAASGKDTISSLEKLDIFLKWLVNEEKSIANREKIFSVLAKVNEVKEMFRR